MKVRLLQSPLAGPALRADFHEGVKIVKICLLIADSFGGVSVSVGDVVLSEW